MTWQSKLHTQLIGGTGETLDAGGGVFTWDSRTANGDATAVGVDTPQSSLSPYLGRKGVIFEAAGPNAMHVNDIHTVLEGAAPTYSMAILFRMDAAPSNTHLFGAGSLDDEFLSLFLGSNGQITITAKTTGQPNQNGTLTPTLFLEQGGIYAIVLKSEAGTYNAVTRRLDQPAQTEMEPTVVLPSPNTLEQGVIGARFISGAELSHSNATVYEAMIFDDALTGSSEDEPAGGELWDVLKYLATDNRPRKRRLVTGPTHAKNGNTWYRRPSNAANLS